MASCLPPAPAPVLAPPLVRHVAAVRGALLALLSTRDAVSLLATSRAWRGDEAATAQLLARDAAASRHWFQRCARDWSVATPSFRWAYDCDGRAHDQKRWAGRAEGSRGLASLVSLAGLLQTRLRRVLYSSMDGHVNTWQAVPFALPLGGNAAPPSLTTLDELCAALDGVAPGLGAAFGSPEPAVSEPGLHWENMESGETDVGARQRRSVCRFCAAADAEIQRFTEEAEAFYESETTGDGAAERTAAAAALYEAGKRDDAREEMVPFLLRHDRFPLLKLMEPVTERVRECVGRAASSGFCDALCPTVYRPLHAFFRDYGFRFVRRAKTTLFRGSDELPRSEISSVEMVGGVAPHGWFVGVYLVEIYA